MISEVNNQIVGIENGTLDRLIEMPFEYRRICITDDSITVHERQPMVRPISKYNADGLLLG